MSAALETVDAELAVAVDREAARQAQLLLEACQAAGALEWVFALALFLDHGPALAGMGLSASVPLRGLHTLLKRASKKA